MTDTKHINIGDYDYPLPQEKIARYPCPERDHSKLLVYRHGQIGEDRFFNLPKYLSAGHLMVFNNTKVIQARLHFRKPSGALIEVFCLEPYVPRDYEQMFQQKRSCQWVCMIGNLKKWKDGKLSMSANVRGEDITLTATRNGQMGNSQIIGFDWGRDDISFAEILMAVGELPIPPYLNRATEESDLRNYQTVYSKIKGSVAAPTAGLHFTQQVLQALDKAGIERDEVTLHVGAGTFKPVETEEIGGHTMHSEYISVSRGNIENLLKHGGKCIAVGTTSVRTLESLYYIGVKLSDNNQNQQDLSVSQWMPYEYAASTCPAEASDDRTNGKKRRLTTQQALKNILDYLDRNNIDRLHTTTQIIIAPGYKYHIVEAMITNFHQPKSTLLLLVSAFVGDDWHKIYRYALDNEFRFLSYGDSSLLIP